MNLSLYFWDILNISDHLYLASSTWRTWSTWSESISLFFQFLLPSQLWTTLTIIYIIMSYKEQQNWCLTFKSYFCCHLNLQNNPKSSMCVKKIYFFVSLKKWHIYFADQEISQIGYNWSLPGLWMNKKFLAPQSASGSLDCLILVSWALVPSTQVHYSYCDRVHFIDFFSR